MVRPLFLGHEPSQAPVVIDLLRSARALAEGGVTNATLSVRFGHRFVVNGAGVPLEMLGKGHFSEVVDYDPHQDHVMCLGEMAPSPRAGLHALVYRAKKEVGAIVDVEVPEDHAALARLPRAETGKSLVDLALGTLERLRSADAVVAGKRHVLAVGQDAAAARANLERALTEG